MRVRLWCVGMAIVATAACGKSGEEKQAEKVKDGAQQVQSSAENMAKGLEDMTKGLAALTGNATDPNQKPVDPVSFKELQTAFGDISGWEKAKPTGERMTAPVNYSEAKVTYTKGESEIEVQISDSAFNQMLMGPYSMFLTSGYEKETSDGYEKSTKVGEYPGWEKWNSSDKDGELSAIVNKRFIVQVNGRRIDDEKMLQTAMNSVDLKKLAALK
jgi:hypothetical protein